MRLPAGSTGVSPALPLSTQQAYLYNVLAALWHLLDTLTPECTGMGRGFLLVE